MAIGPDRVQVLKQESAANGGDGADDVPYVTGLSPQEDALEAAGFYLQDALNRDEAVYLERAGMAMRFVDQENPTGFSLTQLAAGGFGLSESEHTVLNTLTHALAEDCDVQVVRSGGQVTEMIFWTSPARTTKIRETLIARSGGLVTTVTMKQYDGAGTLIATFTQSFTRSSGQVATIEGDLTQLAGSSGLSESQHNALDTLTHVIAEDCDVQVVRSGGRVTEVIFWTSPARTTKIRETLIVRSSGLVTAVTMKQYNGTGTLVATFTQSFTRSSGQVATIEGDLT